MDDDFAYLILEIVAEIPEGKVATYKQIAMLAGKERNARQVGKVLSYASFYGRYPCHRVVNSVGRIAPDWPQQRDLLEEEGVQFKSNGNVDMARFQWKM